jgi:hypothetical protein
MEDMMSSYKAIATLTWRFESDRSYEECLQYAKEQLEKILDTHPKGIEFDGFGVQMDLAKMKDRVRMIHLGEFSPNDVFPHITLEDVRREYIAGGKSYFVRMNSDRYFVFRENPACVSCGLVGTRMMLDMNPGDLSPHFNLYGEEDGRLVLMTKDHIIPKSRGGIDAQSNFQTMCATCNNLKAACDLTVAQVKNLRQLYNNEEKLPKKELRDLINRVREELAASNVADKEGSNDRPHERDQEESETVGNGPASAESTNPDAGSGEAQA